MKVTGIEDVEFPSADRSNIIYADPADKERDERLDKILDSRPTDTTYSAKVESWIKGSGDSTLLVRAIGGVSTYDGSPFFLDGYFLLEPGRSYLLVLHWDEVQGVYQLDTARRGFDITAGVSVLNHPDTRDLEYFEEMSVDDFVAYVRSLASNDAKTS